MSVSKKKISVKKLKVRDDAAIAEQEAKEREEAENKAREEAEREELAKITKQLCAASPDDDDTINSVLGELQDKVITFTGYIAHVSTVGEHAVLLIRSGDSSEISISGPDFQIICDDVSQIPYASDADLDIEKGLEVKVEATPAGYDDQGNLISLQLVKLYSRGSEINTFAQLDYSSKEVVKAVQTALNNAGFDCGTPDGMAGKRTAAAIGEYRKTRNLDDYTLVDDELVTYLRVRPEIEEAILARSIAEAEAKKKEVTERTSLQGGNKTKGNPTYIANANPRSRKFHKPSCSAVKTMNEGNKVYFYGTRDEVIAAGYTECGSCDP